MLSPGLEAATERCREISLPVVFQAQKMTDGWGATRTESILCPLGMTRVQLRAALLSVLSSKIV